MSHRRYTNCVRVVHGHGRGSDGLSGGSDMPARPVRGRGRAPCIAAAGVGHDWQACRRWCIDGAFILYAHCGAIKAGANSAKQQHCCSLVAFLHVPGLGPGGLGRA